MKKNLLHIFKRREFMCIEIGLCLNSWDEIALWQNADTVTQPQWKEVIIEQRL